ncbi:MAG: SNF2-related protein [Planctomycetota bacterium]|jgi:SNF2 family DNA or RNA helicase
MDNLTNYKQQTIIDFDSVKGQLEIAAPYMLLPLLRGIPQRRFNGKSKRWIAPLTKQNVQYIEVNFNGAVFGKRAAGAINSYKEELAGKTAGEPWPDDFAYKTKPRQYQLEALKKIAPLSTAALLMDMGTGKSKICIDYLSQAYLTGRIKAVLIICPLTIRRNWLSELKKHCPVGVNPYLLFTNKVKDYRGWLADEATKFPWLFVGIESLGQGRAAGLAAEFIEKHKGAYGIVIDEASKIKNHRANRTRRSIELGKSAACRLIMTGTPVSQGALDLYAQFQFLDPDIVGIGNWWAFRNRYAVMGGYGDKQVVGYKNLDELTELIKPHVFQAKKEEVLKELPPKQYEKRYVGFSATQKHCYSDVGGWTKYRDAFAIEKGRNAVKLKTSLKNY